MSPDPAARNREPQFGLGKSLLFSALLIGMFLGLAEGAVRGWAYYLREDVERWDVASQTFVLVPGRHRSQFGTALVNSEGFVGGELATPGPDLWRIAAVGDSCTYGAGDDRFTYPAMLDALLEERERPGRRYDVVNAGISGLNSELAMRRLATRVLPLEPDVVTIYIGWNDLMKFDPAGQAGATRWSGVARALDNLWLVKGLRKLMFYHVRPRLRPPRTGPESATGRFADFRPTFYEDNLEGMVAAVRDAGAAPLLATLPTVVRPTMTGEDLRRAGVIFPYFPSAYGVGDLIELVEAYNAAVLRVAEAGDVPVVDLAASFRAVEDPTPLFWDTMHTSPEGMARIAEALLAGLERHGLLGDAPPTRSVATGAP